MSDPDPDRVLMNYVKSPPLWVDSKLYNECHHCDSRFRKGHQHYCRLCGHMFCSMCSDKFHLPIEFKKKGKEGPVRVCFGCRDDVFKRRGEAGDPVTNNRPRQKITIQQGRTHIHPPEWVDPFEYPECLQCHEKKPSHPFHCRVCGETFCSKCTIKTDVPANFKQKNKSGPIRVCFECRYKMKDNAVLDSRPPPADIKTEYEKQQERMDAGKNRDTTKQQRDSILTEGSVDLQAPSSVSQMKTLNVLKKGSNGKQNLFLTTIEVSEDGTLAEINDLVVEKFPALKSRPFHYLCRSKSVCKAHWDVFKVKHFPEVIISRGEAPGDLDLEIGSASISMDKTRNPSIGDINPSDVKRPDPPPPQTVAAAEQTGPAAAAPAVSGGASPRADSKSQAAAPMSVRRTHPDAIWVRCKYRYEAQTQTNVDLEAGDVMYCIKHEKDAQWWFGEHTGQNRTGKGWFPASYVETCDEPK
eukprot:311539_1